MDDFVQFGLFIQLDENLFILKKLDFVIRQFSSRIWLNVNGLTLSMSFSFYEIQEYSKI